MSNSAPKLRVDPEFESKIPPLTEDEYRQLEYNIHSEGAVLMPIIVWQGTIVDGHNRYKIVGENPGIPFTVHEKEFENRYEALAWICRNQLGRRNLTPIQKKMLIGDRYEAEKMPMVPVEAFKAINTSSWCVAKMTTHQNREKRVKELRQKQAPTRVTLKEQANFPRVLPPPRKSLPVSVRKSFPGKSSLPSRKCERSPGPSRRCVNPSWTKSSARGR